MSPDVRCRRAFVLWMGRPSFGGRPRRRARKDQGPAITNPLLAKETVLGPAMELSLKERGARRWPRWRHLLQVG